MQIYKIIFKNCYKLLFIEIIGFLSHPDPLQKIGKGGEELDSSLCSE